MPSDDSVVDLARLNDGDAQKSTDDLAFGDEGLGDRFCDIGGHGEVLVQVVDVLEHPPLHRAGDGDGVGHRQVLVDLAEPDAPRVGADAPPPHTGVFLFTVLLALGGVLMVDP